MVVGVGEALLVVGFALAVVLELVDVLWLLVGVALALVLADALRDGVAEADALPEGRALTEADALLDAEELADAEELPEADALADAVGDFDTAACLAAFFVAGFFVADSDAAEVCAAVAERPAVGDFAGWMAESRRAAA